MAIDIFNDYHTSINKTIYFLISFCIVKYILYIVYVMAALPHRGKL